MKKQMVVTRTSIPHEISWKEVPWKDVFSGLSNLPQKGTPIDVLYNHLGAGFEVYLEWALKELSLEDSKIPDDERRRHRTNAVIHARRAVENLLDNYVRRDWLTKKLRVRANFSEKLDLLEKGPGVSVPGDLIKALISAPRNDAEHHYQQPSHEQTVQAVQAAEHVIGSLISKSNPLRGNAFFGTILFDHSTSEGKFDKLHFHGFVGPFAMTWECSDKIVRVGIGISNRPDFAEINFCEISDLSEQEHLNLLDWWTSIRHGNYEAWQEPNMREKFQMASLDGPPQKD